MKLGDVLRKERERKKLRTKDVAAHLGIPDDKYTELEAGTSPIEEWGPKLALIAIKLSSPTSRLISQTGMPAQAKQRAGQCGKLIMSRREELGVTREALAKKLDWTVEEVTLVEEGKSPIEEYAPLLLQFAETVAQPVFNLFYPCGLPFDKLNDYP